MTLFALLISVLAQDNALDPQYSFKTCKITFKHLKSGGTEADVVVYVKGSKSIRILKQTKNGKPDRTVYRGTDGVWVFDVTTDASGRVTDAERKRHPAYFLKADLAELSDDDKKKLNENLPNLWNKFSPAFSIDDWSITAKFESAGTEKICGKDCDVFEYKGQGPQRKFWRMHGTNLFLKDQMFATFEADKFEENVDVPDSTFDLPAVGRWTVPRSGIDRQHAIEMFKMLVGKQAQADPDRKPEVREPVKKVQEQSAKVTIDGNEYTLQDITIDLPNDGWIRCMSGGWPGMTIQVHKAKLKQVADAVGKEYTLGEPEDKHEDNWMDFHIESGWICESKSVVLKVIGVKDGVAELSLGGTFTDQKNDKDVDIKLSFKARIQD